MIYEFTSEIETRAEETEQKLVPYFKDAEKTGIFQSTESAGSIPEKHGERLSSDRFDRIWI